MQKDTAKMLPKSKCVDLNSSDQTKPHYVLFIRSLENWKCFFNVLMIRESEQAH